MNLEEVKKLMKKAENGFKDYCNNFLNSNRLRDLMIDEGFEEINLFSYNDGSKIISLIRNDNINFRSRNLPLDSTLRNELNNFEREIFNMAFSNIIINISKEIR